MDKEVFRIEDFVRQNLILVIDVDKLGFIEGSFSLIPSGGLLFPAAEKVGKNAVKNQWFLNSLFAAMLRRKTLFFSATRTDTAFTRYGKYDRCCYFLLPQTVER